MPNTEFANISLLRFNEQSSTPSTPASGFSGVFMMSDGLYIVNDSGTVTGPFIDSSAGIGSAAILAPDSINRNLIQPTGDYHGLVLKGNASQAEEILEIRDSSDNFQLSVNHRGRLRLHDSATTPPLSINEVGSTPSNAVANDIYLDNGSNTASGNVGFRRHTGSAWEDINPASSPLTTAGDTFVSDGSDARLPIGTNDQIRIVDTAEATKSKWVDIPTAIAGTMPSDQYAADESSNYTTTSTSFVDVDATNFSLTITTHGGDVLLGFSGSSTQSALSNQHYDFYETTTGKYASTLSATPDDGSLGVTPPSASFAVISFVRVWPGLAAGTYTFRLRWKVTANTATLYAGAGTPNGDLHPQFLVRELS